MQSLTSIVVTAAFGIAVGVVITTLYLQRTGVPDDVEWREFARNHEHDCKRRIVAYQRELDKTPSSDLPARISAQTALEDLMIRSRASDHAKLPLLSPFLPLLLYVLGIVTPAIGKLVFGGGGG
jgi:hypothetical protein